MTDKEDDRLPKTSDNLEKDLDNIIESIRAIKEISDPSEREKLITILKKKSKQRGDLVNIIQQEMRNAKREKAWYYDAKLFDLLDRQEANTEETEEEFLEYLRKYLIFQIISMSLSQDIDFRDFTKGMEELSDSLSKFSQLLESKEAEDIELTPEERKEMFGGLQNEWGLEN